MQYPMFMTEAQVISELANNKSFLDGHDFGRWRCEWEVKKYNNTDLKNPRLLKMWESGLLVPDDYSGGEGNLLMTVGATDLFNGLVTTGLGTPYNATNAGIGVGDSTTAASAGQTDLQAIAGSAIQTSGFASVTNATPQVITNGSGNWTVTPTVGSAVVISGITTDTQINNTWEVQASSTTTVTALNSTAGGVAGALASGVMKQINRYFQIVNGAPSVSTNTCVFVSVFGANNGNYHWQEFSVSNGLAATNKQQAPPSPHILDRAVADNGTKVQGASWTFSVTLSLT